EPEPAEPKVGAERDEQPEQELVLEDPDAELGDERGDRGERRPDLAADLAPVRAARLDRLVVAKALRELARLVGVDLWRELVHWLIVASASFDAARAFGSCIEGRSAIGRRRGDPPSEGVTIGSGHQGGEDEQDRKSRAWQLRRVPGSVL